MTSPNPGLLTKYLQDAMNHISWASVISSRCPGGRVVRHFVHVEVNETLSKIENKNITKRRLIEQLLSRELSTTIETIMLHQKERPFASHGYVTACVRLYTYIQALIEISSDPDEARMYIEEQGNHYHCEVVGILLQDDIVQ